MILHLSRMSRNVNRNAYNAGKIKALHRLDENMLDDDQVEGCGQLSNLSSDFPLGSRKFISELT